MEQEKFDKSLLSLKQGTPADTGIQTMLRFYREGNLTLRPSYQRNEVINRNKASGIIESAVLGIPIPPIYLFKDKEEKLEVIDGQQRLIAFFGFLGKIHDMKTNLNGYKLIGLKILKNLNGLNYEDECFRLDLNEKILNFSIKTFTFDEEKGFEESLKYEIFERLNKNPYPIKVNSFELWNCIYLSDFTRAIKEIAASQLFLKSIARKNATKDLRMDNENDILRFITLADNYQDIANRNELSKSLMLQQVEKHFTNKTQELEIEKIKKSFNQTLKNIQLVFGSNTEIAKMTNDVINPYPKLTLTVLDILFLCFFDEDIKFLTKYRDGIIDLFKSFFKNKENRAIIQNAKSGEDRISSSFLDRVNLLKKDTLEKIRKDYGVKKSKRTPIRDGTLAERLLNKQNGLCLYCKNQIKPTDKYEIDHLQPLDDFGNSEENNLAILHKRCNQEKSNKKIILQ